MLDKSLSQPQSGIDVPILTCLSEDISISQPSQEHTHSSKMLPWWQAKATKGVKSRLTSPVSLPLWVESPKLVKSLHVKSQLSTLVEVICCFAERQASSKKVPFSKTWLNWCIIYKQQNTSILSIWFDESEKCIHPCNHHHIKETEHNHHSKKLCCAPLQ